MAADDPRAAVPGAPYLTTEELRRDVSALREILQARLDGMDRAAVVLSETVNRTPTEIQTQISHLKELHDEKFRSVEVQSAERFSSVELQFRERDTRTDQAAKAGKEALDAALLAAKELVTQQNEANRGEAAKTEQNFTKQIDAQAARIDELKERIDRGEGVTAGGRDAVTENRSGATFEQAGTIARAAQLRTTISLVMAAVSLTIALVTVIVLVTRRGG
jgi:hypothetical protein